MADNEPRSFFETLRGGLSDAATLARLDGMLLLAEFREKIDHAIHSLLLAVVAVLSLAAAIAFLGVAAFELLVDFGLRPAAAAGSLAVFFFLVSLFLVMAALRRVREWSLMPSRAIAQIRKNFASQLPG